jgi:hypothetical protein
MRILLASARQELGMFIKASMLANKLASILTSTQENRLACKLTNL